MAGESKNLHAESLLGELLLLVPPTFQDSFKSPDLSRATALCCGQTTHHRDFLGGADTAAARSLGKCPCSAESWDYSLSLISSSWKSESIAHGPDKATANGTN